MGLELAHIWDAGATSGGLVDYATMLAWIHIYFSSNIPWIFCGHFLSWSIFKIPWRLVPREIVEEVQDVEDDCKAKSWAAFTFTYCLALKIRTLLRTSKVKSSSLYPLTTRPALFLLIHHTHITWIGAWCLILISTSMLSSHLPVCTWKSLAYFVTLPWQSIKSFIFLEGMLWVRYCIKPRWEEGRRNHLSPPFA